jgi:23S rRNA (cytosine1962-C5)-methyltransferase
MIPQVKLKPGREKTIRLRHPWIFAGAVEDMDSSIPPGSTVDILSHTGEWLARGSINVHSQIAIRIWTWKKEQAIHATFFHQRLDRSLQQREILRGHTNAMRLVNAENDGLPGLIIDRYGEFLVVQFLSAGAEFWRQEIIKSISGWENIIGVFERSDVDVREKEGLQKRTGSVHGMEPPTEIVIHENHVSFGVDVRQGHKTGFYLDQRENRTILGHQLEDLPRGLRILNAFSYTGAFSVVAKLHSEATIVQVDSSAPALEQARQNYALNHLASEEDTFLEQDVFQALRVFRDTHEKFDVVILDPPKFAFSKHDLPRASRAYKDINWLAMRILNPGGYLLSFSCSGLVDETLFQQIVFSAAMDAGRNLSILRRLGQASDHPVRLTFPEGHYLKGFLLRAE